jgi:hypothetical protein
VIQYPVKSYPAGQPVIALVGDSILMDGLALSLRKELRAEIVQIDHAKFESREILSSLRPSLIICELDCVGSVAFRFLLEARPGTQIFALNRGSCQVIQLQIFQHAIQSMKEFCQQVERVVENRLAQSVVEHGWE